jgi:hypothetical protein
MSESEYESDEELVSDAVKVTQCLEDYETGRRERKKRIDALSEKNEVVISKEDLSNLVLTKKQIAQLKREQKERDKVEAKERTEKQKAQLAEINERKRRQMDLRKSKEDEGIVLKIKKTQLRSKPKEKAPPKVKEVVVSDEEDEPVKKFQGRKPNLDDLEEKVQKLNLLNQTLDSQNPYLAMIMKNRKR